MAKRNHLYEVRLRNSQGKPISFRTTARSPDAAASKIKSSGTLIRVTKVR